MPQQNNNGKEKLIFYCSIMVFFLLLFFLLSIIFMPENKQNFRIEEITSIENYFKDYQKRGIFVDIIDIGQDNYGKIIEIQVNEKEWNNLHIEQKRIVENMLVQYLQKGHVTVIFRGYNTGDTFYSVCKNFNL